MKPYISIIVPVYNTGHSLQNCLQSILQQTFEDWECWLIDDGSTDDSASICDEFAKNDSRFKVIHKQNGGVSSARNCGLDNATGEYICFCDSDDRVEKEWLKQLTSTHCADLVVAGYKKVDIRKNTTIEMITPCGIYQPLEYPCLIETLLQCSNIGYLWCRTFRNKVIQQHGLRLDDRFFLHEDEEFIFHFMLYARSVETISDTSYIYNEPNFSQKYNRDKVDIIKCCDNICCYTERMGLTPNHPLFVSLIHQYVDALVSAYRHGSWRKVNMLKYGCIIKKRHEAQSKYRFHSKTRLFIFFCHLPSCLYIRVNIIFWNIYNRRFLKWLKHN